jgi:hypothetical protein
LNIENALANCAIFTLLSLLVCSSASAESGIAAQKFNIIHLLTDCYKGLKFACYWKGMPKTIDAVLRHIAELIASIYNARKTKSFKIRIEKVKKEIEDLATRYNRIAYAFNLN